MKRNETTRVAMYLVRQSFDKSFKDKAEVLSPGRYSSVGRACSVIERRIKLDRTLRRRIEQIRGMVSSTSIQKKTCPVLPHSGTSRLHHLLTNFVY